MILVLLVLFSVELSDGFFKNFRIVIVKDFVLGLYKNFVRLFCMVFKGLLLLIVIIGRFMYIVLIGIILKCLWFGV